MNKTDYASHSFRVPPVRWSQSDYCYSPVLKGEAASHTTRPAWCKLKEVHMDSNL